MNRDHHHPHRQGSCSSSLVITPIPRRRADKENHQTTESRQSNSQQIRHPILHAVPCDHPCQGQTLTEPRDTLIPRRSACKKPAEWLHRRRTATLANLTMVWFLLKGFLFLPTITDLARYHPGAENSIPRGLRALSACVHQSPDPPAPNVQPHLSPTTQPSRGMTRRYSHPFPFFVFVSSNPIEARIFTNTETQGDDQAGLPSTKV